MLIMSACIVAYVMRETLEDLQKKKDDHDGNHDRPSKSDS